MDFSKYTGEIAQELKAIIGTNSSEFYQMMRYHLGWVDESGNPLSSDTGKLLRPTLCLIACKAVGGTTEKALTAAAVIELVHNFSLIHDDIEDQSDYRRHRRTVWNLWGQAQAINVGDGMFSLCRLALLRLPNKGVTAQKVLDVIQMLDQACVRLCEGQYLDMCFENRYDVSVDEYMQMIGKKTASLISCSLKTGAALGTDNDLSVQGLEQFGWKLGIAFQIQDDILGIWGAEDKTGKSISDIAQRKKSLPIIYVLASEDNKCAGLIRSIYSKEIIGKDDVARVNKALDAAGARDYCQKLAMAYFDKAISILDNLQLDRQSQDELREIADFFIERDF
ncbi:polyprenyl synthetase family protein [Chloroflexota bacterium]